jgi:hypothetical protein
MSLFTKQNSFVSPITIFSKYKDMVLFESGHNSKLTGMLPQTTSIANSTKISNESAEDHNRKAT